MNKMAMICSKQFASKGCCLVEAISINSRSLVSFDASEAYNFLSMETVLLLILFLYFLTRHFLGKNKNLPPSPRISFPVIGHLYLVRRPLHRTFAKISNRHGPVLLLRFGSRPVVVVSSPSAAEECFTKNDVILANRPRLLAGKLLGYNYTLLPWAPYGDHWRNLRRIASIELFSTTRLQSFEGTRKDEARSLLSRLFRASSANKFHAVDMRSAFFELTLNNIMRMIAGKRYCGEDVVDSEEARKFNEIVQETFRLSGASNMGDFVPMMNWLGLDSLEKRMKILQEKRDLSIRELIKEKRKTRSKGSSEEGSKTLIDVLLSLQQSEPEYYTDEVIKGLMLSLITAGTDTTTGTMEWALSLLLNNPKALEKAREEIDNRIGHSRLIEESDFASLPYLRGIVNETLRICPAGALIPPHEASKDCTISGFRIPRGTMIFVNLWAMQNDPNLWEEPEKFRPERFVGLEGQRDGFKFMPFGSGRRGCPGEGLATRVVGLALGSIIQCFEWERTGEELVDMSEGSGLTMPKAQPLVAKCRPRPVMVSLLSQL